MSLRGEDSGLFLESHVFGWIGVFVWHWIWMDLRFFDRPRFIVFLKEKTFLSFIWRLFWYFLARRGIFAKRFHFEEILG